jgi:hypothetical protein
MWRSQAGANFSAQPRRVGRWTVGLVLMLLFQTGCAGSPATLRVPPDFEVATRAGIAGVSIHQSLPGMTDAESAHVIRTAMESAAPGSVFSTPAKPPYPALRIVWHVQPMPTRGGSRVIVNVFAGSVPFAYKLETVDDSAPMAATEWAVRSLSEQLLTTISAQVARPAAKPELSQTARGADDKFL